MNPKKLEWEEKYSVGVQIIDDQHKQMFETINLLIEVMGDSPTKEQLDGIITRLVQYKKFHFATEEKYFQEFNYENKEEHIVKHLEFTTTLEKLIADSKGDSTVLAFSLVDFLEDWLIDHLMIEDQKYVACFHDHGLT